jgi:dipeptidyl aminopeptidase/acylaminoacyl peptidase
MRLTICSTAVACALCASVSHPNEGSSVVIPTVTPAAARSITIDDMLRIREIDTISVAPDGQRYAIFVRQRDAKSNRHRTDWFVGSTTKETLSFVGDAGELTPQMDAEGYINGELRGGESRWSPDGQYIAYLLRRDGQKQIWRSRVADGKQEPVTNNAGDVLDFYWSRDGRRLLFTAGPSREERRQIDAEKARSGYRYDEDLFIFEDAIRKTPRHALTPDLIQFWVIDAAGEKERPASSDERKTFESLQASARSGTESVDAMYANTGTASIRREDGGLAWLERVKPRSEKLQVRFSAGDAKAQVDCRSEHCIGPLRKIWWSADASEVFIWRAEGMAETVYSKGNGFYAWSPPDSKVRALFRTTDDLLQDCLPSGRDHVVCIRQTSTLAPHVAAIDLRRGKLRVLADVNPELRNVRLGKVERFEWDTPRFSWNEPGGALAGTYARRAYGYILYPPDFNPAKKYPVFIEPYVAAGFDSLLLGAEHPTHVYAANGFVVLRTEFPALIDLAAQLGADLMIKLYSKELDFPHLSMYMESTLRGLDTAAKRGFIDLQRVGIGGVSHGTFVPLYLLQNHPDRIAAISISSTTWGPHEYYWGTARAREKNTSIGGMGMREWRPRPEGEGREFWSRIDIADHVDVIRAPVLMNLADEETYGLLRFIRHLYDAGKPYDAYVFPDETHIKWQPAHIEVIAQRNLDWFRFWLQGSEDSTAVKAEQYQRWKKLRRNLQSSAPP